MEEKLKNSKSIVISELLTLVSIKKSISYFENKGDINMVESLKEQETIFHSRFEEISFDLIKDVRSDDLSNIFKDDLSLALDILDNYIMIKESRLSR